MTEFLVKRLIKDYENTSDAKVRGRYGVFSSMVGIICNILLFVSKFIIGTLANSISIISDGFNNLSDCASCVITMFGYKMAAKPADKDHPFGHGRMEYLTSLALSMIIIFVGVELIKNSIGKLIHPEKVDFSYVALIVLILSILMKFWMFLFNKKLGRRINSGVMEATAKDSLNDVFATTSTLIALVASIFTDIPVDAIMGIVVSVLIIKAGVDITSETVDQLLGKPADEELVNNIKELVEAYEVSLGMHDLIIHSYGPGNLIGSVHVEVDSSGDIMVIHDAIDMIEREIYEKLGVMMTIHMDPVEVGNEKIDMGKRMVKEIISEISSELSIHDFRMVSGPTHTNLIFDVVLPYDCGLTENDVKQAIDEALAKKEEKYYAVITFDKKLY